jgi:hypothetical protein
MASNKQIEANRANARKSTGPKTLMGKFTSRFNALKHGFASQKMVTIVGESNDAYLELFVNVMFEYDPQTTFQRQLVEDLAILLWRKRRCAALEAGVFNARYCEVRAKSRETPESGDDQDQDDQDQQVRATEECLLYGLTFIREAETGDVLAKLSRYETSLMNSIKKTVKMLEESGCTATPRGDRANGADSGFTP